MKVDLTQRNERRQLLARVDAQASCALVLTEGVIPYLANNEVATLAEELRAMQHARFWILDYFSAQALEYRRYRRHKGVSLAMQNAPFKFEPKDWLNFFRQYGWHVKELRYFPEEARRLGRPIPLPPLLALLLRISGLWTSQARQESFLKFAGYALLEPTGR